MKIVCAITVLEEEIGKDQFEKLVQIYPMGRKFTVFMSRFNLDDARTQTILEFLARCGKRQRTSAWKKRQPDEIRMEYIREYEESDYAECQYLEMRPTKTIAYGTERTTDGVLEMEYDSDYFEVMFGVAGAFDETIVSDEVRERMLVENFKGLIFRQVRLVGEGSEDFSDPIWELRSDRFLPSVTNKLCDLDGGTDSNNPDKGLTIDEGLYLPVELHYGASAIRTMEPFDVAMTREARGARLRYHARVVSQRFYQFCRKNKYKMHWVPVRLDEGASSSQESQTLSLSPDLGRLPIDVTTAQESPAPVESKKPARPRVALGEALELLRESRRSGLSVAFPQSDGGATQTEIAEAQAQLPSPIPAMWQTVLKESNGFIVYGGNYRDCFVQSARYMVGCHDDHDERGKQQDPDFGAGLLHFAVRGFSEFFSFDTSRMTAEGDCPVYWMSSGTFGVKRQWPGIPEFLKALLTP